MAKNCDKFFRHFRHNGENGKKIDGENGKNGKMAKNNGKNGENFRHYGKNFRHYGKNGEKMFAIFAIMAEIDGKMAKINGENGEFFLAFFAISPWRKSRKKYLSLSMANGNESHQALKITVYQFVFTEYQ
ncbi:MAG: hypothetical protein GY820_34385, partial [Gammaproteobacteria bacterium]|nr:hypothetical protein [Gammaproteobacteria bacterium]